MGVGGAGEGARDDLSASEPPRAEEPDTLCQCVLSDPGVNEKKQCIRW